MTTCYSISVLNKHQSGIARDDVYIGRPSVLGNPFVIGRDGSRDECIEKYRHWLRVQRHSATPTGAKVRDALAQIRWRVEHGPVNLVCFCAPRRCHGDVIKQLIEQGEI